MSRRFGRSPRRARIRLPSPLQALFDSRNANVAIEFAISAPIFLTVLFAIFEFGQLLWTASALQFAVEEASRCVTVRPAICADAASVQTYAVNTAAGLNFSSSVFSFAVAACGNRVTASFPYVFATPALFPYSITLTAQSCFPQ
ncbi:MAG: pilus assembly protein [Rhodospirillales bacterium]|nr:pilus assembly protein [Rhodospirillales bacterium]